MATLLAIIMDEGCILNTRELEHRAHQSTVRSFREDWKLSEVEYRSLVGKPLDTMTDAIAIKCELNTVTTTGYLNRYDEFMGRLLLRETRACNGALDFLYYAQQRDIRIVIASNAMEKHVTLALQTSGIAMYVDRLVGRESVRKSKPSPDVFFQALQRVPGGTSKNTLVIEDSQSGVMAAKASGLKAMSVRHGYNTEHAFNGAAARAGQDDFATDPAMVLYNLQQLVA
jgi:beta-phosphoglucomutase-like phosphatase (HAD superfamily)